MSKQRPFGWWWVALMLAGTVATRAETVEKPVPAKEAAGPVAAQRAINFNEGWSIAASRVTEAQENVSLPRAWNEAFAYRVPIADLPTDTVRYTKRFAVPETWKNRQVFIEFEGARQSAEVWLNGCCVGRHENGVMAFGFDLTPYLKIGEDNFLEVLTDNDWDYREKGVSTEGEILRDGNQLPGNELHPASFQWNNKNFNANYGGLPKNVRLHVLPRLYQTLPLYSQLGTTGVYIYAKDFDIAGHSATLHAESQVKNETGRTRKFRYEVEVTDRQTGLTVLSLRGKPQRIRHGETLVVAAEGRANGLHFWSWGYGYLYNVTTRLVAKGLTDELFTVTGFRKTTFGQGRIQLNDRTLMVHGYAQRTSNEWPGVGLSVPPWMSDYSNRLMVQSGGNLVRWMHVCPWKQDIESCDRVGLLEAMPAGDAEKDVTGRHWEQRVALMRDAIIYNRNNPSIVFYECGNKGISEDHMKEMMALRDTYDPHGGRAIGSREMLSDTTVAEYGGEMLYLNKSRSKPVWAMEYCRDEALRRYWDDWSYPYHRHGDGPLYRNADASAYNQNNDQFAVEMVRRWYDYWRERPGTGERVSSGGVKIVFSDTNTHCRGESNYRTSGVVDAMRLPKDAFYAHRVMWDGWVTPETSHTYIVGHWNYEPGTVKPVYVVSDAPCVKLFLNGREVGCERVDYHFLHTFDSIPFEPGTLTAVSYNETGQKLSEHSLHTAGEFHALRLTSLHPLGHRLNANGADMMLIEVEAVDREGRRCPLDHRTVLFETEGPIEWIGGIARDDSGTNAIRSKDLPLECGVNRVMVRSTGGKGRAVVRANQTDFVLDCGDYPVPTLSYLERGETPSTPSYRDIKQTLNPLRVVAGCNPETAPYSLDNSEDTEWKNDGKLSTAWIRYEFAEPVRVDEIAMKLTGWRQRSYPLEILADTTLVWEGKTPTSLGYVHLLVEHPVAARTLTVRLKGSVHHEEAFAQITELGDTQDSPASNATKAETPTESKVGHPAAVKTEISSASNTAQTESPVKGDLRIVECDFLQRLP